MEGPLSSLGWGAIIRDPYMSEGLMGLIFQGGTFCYGFGGMYMYRRFGDAELAAYAGMEKDGTVSRKRPAEVTVHCRGSLYKRMIVQCAVTAEGMPPSMRPSCYLMEDDWGAVYPVHLFMPWVLPGILPGQPVTMQVTYLASRFHLIRRGEGRSEGSLESLMEQKKKWFRRGPEALVAVKGRVTALRPAATAIEGEGEQTELSRFVMATVDAGREQVEISLSPELMGRAGETLRVGDTIEADAILSGNVRVGAYRDGLIADEMSYLTAMRYALLEKAGDFLDTVWDESCAAHGESGETIPMEDSHGLSRLMGRGPFSIVKASRKEDILETALLAGNGDHRKLLFLDLSDEGRIKGLDIRKADKERTYPEAEGIYDRE